MQTPLLETTLNHLLKDLPHKDCLNILKHCERIDLALGDFLYHEGEPIEYVYFPETSILALVNLVTGHAPLGITLIGNEGMLDVASLLTDHLVSIQGAVVQNSGSILRIKALVLRQEMQTSPSLLLTLNHYLYCLIKHISKSSGCAHFHKIAPRLARWLLMTDERASSAAFHLTQNMLAGMLGVRRSSITVAAGVLQRKHLISYHRGMIAVTNRKGLKAEACECY